jgi:hypothetical protein
MKKKSNEKTSLRVAALKTGAKELRKIIDSTYPRVCAICGRDSTQIKVFHRHHLRYAPPPELAAHALPEITVDLCFEHHNQIHGRATYHNYFEKIYGKDLGGFVFAAKVVELYNKMWPGGELLHTVIDLTSAHEADKIMDRKNGKADKQNKTKKGESK